MDEDKKCGKVSQIDPLIKSTSTKCSSTCNDDSGSSDCAGPNEMMVYELSSDANSDAIMGLKAYPSEHDNSYSYLKLQTTNTDSDKHFYAITEKTNPSEVAVTEKLTIKSNAQGLYFEATKCEITPRTFDSNENEQAFVV